jgi:hypothetical protein
MLRGVPNLTAKDGRPFSGFQQEFYRCFLRITKLEAPVIYYALFDSFSNNHSMVLAIFDPRQTSDF